MSLDALAPAAAQRNPARPRPRPRPRLRLSLRRIAEGDRLLIARLGQSAYLYIAKVLRT